jgi:RNA polymerase sigma-70 factor (ECF subfamily)
MELGNRAPSGRPTGVAPRLAIAIDARHGPEEIEELDLLRRAAGGDERAVSRLFRAHAGRIHRTVARILGSTDPDVEDVVQQVFLAALDGADRFDGRSRVSTWLVGIATRRALDQARSRWRRGRWQRLGARVGLGRPAARPDYERDALDEARAALDALTPDQRTVFVLHEVEGYTLKEIYEMTDTGISTLHARLKAARKRLDAVLAADAGDGGDHGA